jgi:UDP:flavonoid glycosyltransferase YjiC (YdhE family)
VRILFTFIGGYGHFHPLVPIARAAEAAGHTVAVAGAGSLVPAIAEAGFTAFGTSRPRPAPTPDAAPPAPEPLRPWDPEEEARAFRDSFAERGATRHAAAVLDVAREWRPDVVVRDEVDFGSAIAAERYGVPCATVLVLASGGLLRRELVTEPLNALRADHDLPPDPDLHMLDRDLVLSPFPAAFRSPGFPLPPTAFAFRPTPVAPTTPATGTPTVYLTLGTVFNTEAPDLFARVLSGLTQTSANVVVTVGARVDPASLGPVPDRVRIERFVPQGELLPGCDLVVSHGGSGSVLGALAHGLPSVLIPLGADQPYNAQRSVELGTARVLDPVALTADDVRATVSEVLTDDGCRRAAERMRAEIAGLPGVEETVPLLERLV